MNLPFPGARAKEIVSEIGIAKWILLDEESGLEFSDKDLDESAEVPIFSGEIEVVEVKSGKGRLTKVQRDEYSNLVKTGFPLRLIRVSIVSFAKNHFEVEDKLLGTATGVKRTHG